MSVEKLGIPTATMVTTMFETVAKTIAFKKGMPNQRIVYVPHPIAGRPESLLREYIEGKDPVTGKEVAQEIINALTGPPTDEEGKTGTLEREEQKAIESNTRDNLHRLFLNNQWTDGLPIILPTREKVDKMLKGTHHQPDEVVGTMAPSSPHEAWEFTVEKVAINAVMAGAEPEFLPVILAIASTGVTCLFSSTTSFARIVVVNGPIRDQIGMNSGIGAMGPFSHVNAAIGRAWTLISRNLGGGAIPGETYMGSQGNNLNYNNVCIAENEEKSPWQPLHVQKGFSPLESAVSLFHGWCIIHQHGATGGEKIYHKKMSNLLGSFSPYSSETNEAGALILADPIVARDLNEMYGFGTKEKLSQWLQENTLMTAGDYWDNSLVHSFSLPLARKGVEPFASWLELPKDTAIPRFPTPNAINIVVVGGETNAFWQAGDFRHFKSASIDSWR
ncbi:UGSC family (seleno)protein [Thermodesulfobacteriota bacterium]